MINRDEVKHIAKLARLELTEQEVEKMQKDLSSVLDYFNLLKKIKTSKHSPVVRTTGLNRNAAREDEIVEKPASLANNLIAAAPNRKDEYIKVKAIL